MSSHRLEWTLLVPSCQAALTCDSLVSFAMPSSNCRSFNRCNQRFTRVFLPLQRTSACRVFCLRCSDSGDMGGRVISKISSFGAGDSRRTLGRGAHIYIFPRSLLLPKMKLNNINSDGNNDPKNGRLSIEDQIGPRHIYQASSTTEIQATLAKLSERESFVIARLNSLIVSQKDLSRELGKLDLMRAHLGSQAVATRSISKNLISNAASTANRLSSAVQRLDLEQARVKATLDVVEQVAELKACVLGVTGSMGAPQDWETAAGYLNKASKIPKDIVEGSFAEEIVPSAEVPDPPKVTLENAAESLCGLFLREFEKAAQDGNGAKVTRFFKLFPLIGRSDVGLDVYGRYVCQGVASRARANLSAGSGGGLRKEGYFYANALTKLFEHIAQIVEQHGGLVERHYGVGRMVRVIERLQVEADVQGGIIIDTWNDERSIDRKLTDIRSYAFTFLVQSFLSTQNVRNGTSRTASPAAWDGVQEPLAQEAEGGDMKDVDGFLSEIAIMLGRWSLYSRFIAAKCQVRFI